MSADVLKKRISQKQEAIQKLQVKIGKFQKRLETMLKKIKANNWDENNYNCMKGYPEHEKAFDLIWDYTYLKQDLEKAIAQLPKEQKLLQEYQERLERESKKYSQLKELPEALLKLRDNLEITWTRQDIECREFYRQAYNQLGYKEFIKKYSSEGYSLLKSTDEEIAKEAKLSAKVYVDDLYLRVFSITGKVTVVNCVYLGESGVNLNGTITGENGVARVKTIVAGGFNIQRLHVRTLVQAVK